MDETDTTRAGPPRRFDVRQAAGRPAPDPRLTIRRRPRPEPVPVDGARRA